MHPQRDTSRIRRKVSACEDHQRIREYPDDNGRNTVQQIRREPNQYAGCGPSIFRKVHAPQKTQRNADQAGDQQHLSATHDRVGHPSTALAYGRGQLREEIPAQTASAMHHEVTKNEHQRSRRDQSAKPSRSEHDGVNRFSPER